MAIPPITNTVQHKPFKGTINYSLVELKELQHIEVVKEFMLEKASSLLDAMAFGKPSNALCQLRTMQNLMFYMLIMYENKLNTLGIETIYDQSYFNETYKSIYCIDCITQGLVCRGIPEKLVKEIMDLYFNDSYGGIGYMIIENTFKIK